MLLLTFVQDPLFSKRIMFHRRRTLTFNILCCLVLNSKHLRTSPQQLSSDEGHEGYTFMITVYLDERRSIQNMGYNMNNRMMF
jgi:hypothetical protein